MSAKSEQVGGSHYKNMAIQPFEYITRNNIGFAEGCVIKYVSRWKVKNGVEDLKKAKHFLELLIEANTEDKTKPTEPVPEMRIQSPGWRYLDVGEIAKKGTDEFEMHGEWIACHLNEMVGPITENQFRRRI